MALDLTPLRTEPSADDRADLRRRARAGEFGPTGLGAALGGYLIVGFVIAVFVVVGLGMLRFARTFPGGLPKPDRGLFNAFPILWFAFIALFAVTFVSAAVRGVLRRHRWHRLALFARANGLSFARLSADPTYPGWIFGHGSDRRAIDHVWSPDGLLADAGTYEFTTGSGEDRDTHTWSYVAFRLPRPMPHLVLDARGNTTKLADFTRDQRVRLGDPFDRTYALWAPAGYGQDAFQLFPPDLLEQLVASPTTYDIEIVDRWLFLYSSGTVDFTDADTWATIEHIQNQIVERVARSSDRFPDRRPAGAGTIATFAGDPGRPLPVAPEGRRLRTSWVPTAIGTAVMLGLVALWHFYLRGIIFP